MDVSGPLAWWPIAVTTLSATAALFSAATAYFTLRLNLVNQREAARPELVIEEYEFHKRTYASTTRPTIAAITFPLKNVGRGPALDIRISGRVHHKDVPDANPIGRVKPIIPAGEESPLVNTIEFFWPLEDVEIFGVGVSLYYFDIYGTLYETFYRFLIRKFDGEESVDGHAIDIARRISHRIPRRAADRVLEGTRPSYVRFAPLPMAHYFDLADKELETDSGAEDGPSASSHP